MVLARSCALTAASAFLAEGLKQKENTVRQRLREWCYEAPAKRGKKRQEVCVETCLAPLLGWILGWWAGTQLAIALDATTLGERFVVLAISVVYREGGITSSIFNLYKGRARIGGVHCYLQLCQQQIFKGFVLLPTISVKVALICR